MLKLTSEHDEAARRARAMYQRVLVGWASDALALRARGLDRPGHRRAFGAVSPRRVRRTCPEAWARPARRVA